jgi:hypothetical protein
MILRRGGAENILKDLIAKNTPNKAKDINL